MNVVCGGGDYDRDQRRAGKVHRRDAPATEEQLTQAIHEYLGNPPSDLVTLMAWAHRCAELVERPGGWCNRLEGVAPSLEVLLQGEARIPAGAHLAALVIRHGRALAPVAPQLCELAIGAVCSLATTDLGRIMGALDRYGACEGMAALLELGPAWLPLVLQCFLAGVPVPAVVGQRLLQMRRSRLAPIIMECFQTHRQTYQAALVARELLGGAERRQAAAVLYEAVVAAGGESDRDLLGGDVHSSLLGLQAGLALSDPMHAMMDELIVRSAAVTDFSIANYFATA